MAKDIKNIAVISDSTKLSRRYTNLLKEYFSVHDIENINHKEIHAIIVIGGDGSMLHSIHRYMNLNIPFYGIRTGHIGFLMNDLDPKELNAQRLSVSINTSKKISVPMLEMHATDQNNKVHKALAFNEVSLLRQTHQAAKTEIHINGKPQLKTLISDGIIISTPAGSTAYNSSAGGPILPLSANLLALTPISPFRPRRWGGALLDFHTEITVKVIDPVKRSVSATADFHEIRDVKKVHAKMSKKQISILFDKDYSLEDKSTQEQFISD